MYIKKSFWKKIFKPYIKIIFLKLILFYQRYISKHSCLFKPTCSQYTLEAIHNYGTFCGTFLGIFRILRCNPFHKGGYNPVPEKYFKARWLY